MRLSQSFLLFSFLDVFKICILNQLRDLKLTVSSQHKCFDHLATKLICCFLSVWVSGYYFYYFPLLFTVLCATLLPTCKTRQLFTERCLCVCCDASSHWSRVKTTDLLVPHAKLSFLPRSPAKTCSFWHFNRHKLQSLLKVRLNIKQGGLKCLAFIEPFS